MLSLLDNTMWNCLSGPHAHFATGAGSVRHYAPGFSPILGRLEPERPDFATLTNYCEPSESFYLDIWADAAHRHGRQAHVRRRPARGSGICTHSDFQGRGLARKLMLKLVRRQIQRGKTPFLHVMSHNAPARAVREDGIPQLPGDGS
jgi:GNAT superfamily N-acetyltransferase